MSDPAGIRLGVNLPLPGHSLRAHRQTIEALPELGYSEVWTGEGGGIDGVTPLAAAAAWQPRLRVGTGVLPVPTRGPAVLAQTASALADLTDGKASLGLGTSVPAHVSAMNDVPFTRPVARLRDTVRFLRSAVRGEYIDEEYETFAVRGFQLPRTSAVPPKIVVGALRPKMVQIGLTEGDGIMTNVLTATDLTKVLETAGPTPPGKDLVAKVFVCPTEDAGHARQAGRRFLGWILNQPPYRAFHDWLGRGDALLESRNRFDTGDTTAAGHALPDALVDALWIHGSPTDCRHQLAAFHQQGVTSLLLYIAPTPELTIGEHTLSEVLAELATPGTP